MSEPDKATVSELAERIRDAVDALGNASSDPGSGMPSEAQVIDALTRNLLRNPTASRRALADPELLTRTAHALATHSWGTRWADDHADPGAVNGLRNLIAGETSKGVPALEGELIAYEIANLGARRTADTARLERISDRVGEFRRSGTAEAFDDLETELLSDPAASHRVLAPKVQLMSEVARILMGSAGRSAVLNADRRAESSRPFAARELSDLFERFNAMMSAQIVGPGDSSRDYGDHHKSGVGKHRLRQNDELSEAPFEQFRNGPEVVDATGRTEAQQFPTDRFLRFAKRQGPGSRDLGGR